MKAVLQIRRWHSAFAVLFFCLVCGTVYGNEDTDLVRYFSAAGADGAVEVDHAPWDRLLKRYILKQDGINLFRYSDVADDDLDRLSDYLEYLQSLNVTGLAPDQQFAYWVNLYNALTIQVILDHYPVDSIKDISYGLLSRGPWKEELVMVEGFSLSLDDIEHGILRPLFQDSRIHYAVNCASISCPNLQDEAFTAPALESLLEASAVEYINSYRGVEVIEGDLVISSIYDWYAGDFGSSDQAIIEHLADYADPDLVAELERFETIDRYRYNWDLNE